MAHEALKTTNQICGRWPKHHNNFGAAQHSPASHTLIRHCPLQWHAFVSHAGGKDGLVSSELPPLVAASCVAAGLRAAESILAPQPLIRDPVARQLCGEGGMTRHTAMHLPTLAAAAATHPSIVTTR